MHILLNVAQATGIQENSYEWRPVLDKVMFTLTMGFRNLIRQVPTAVLQLVLEHYTHAHVIMVKNEAEEAAGWRTKGNSEMG